MRRTYLDAFMCLCWPAVLGALSPRAAFAENWPGFRGPTRQGISYEKDIPLEWSVTSNVAWKAPVPGLGWSSPIVFGDRVFLTTATENGESFRLLCFDRRTGSVLWNKQVHRQKIARKERLNSFATSTPVTDGRMVYTVAFDGSIAAISTEDVPKVPSMLYVKPWLFLVTESGVAKCLNSATGEVLWRERLGGRFSASPVWAEGRIYLLSEKGETAVIDAGPEFKVMASNNLEEKCCASPAVSQGNIFIRSEHNLFCIGRKQ